MSYTPNTNLQAKLRQFATKQRQSLRHTQQTAHSRLAAELEIRPNPEL